MLLPTVYARDSVVKEVDYRSGGNGFKSKHEQKESLGKKDLGLHFTNTTAPRHKASSCSTLPRRSTTSMGLRYRQVSRPGRYQGPLAGNHTHIIDQ